MTTATDPGNRIDASELWRSIGRLESNFATLLEGQRELKRIIGATNIRIDGTNRRFNSTNRRIDDMNQRIDETNRRLDETNRRIDRLFYAILAMGGALIVTTIGSRRFIGG